MLEIAIIGQTASGKSDLAINIAIKLNAYILSLDSLSIYKEIDIVSAKPSKNELSTVKHFGVDEIYPNEEFSVNRFFEFYKNAKANAKRDSKNLIIVGGTGFYLKSMIEGLSELKIDLETKKVVKEQMQNLESAYTLLNKIDREYASKISNSDRYRVEKALNIYFQYKKSPTEFFKASKKDKTIENIDIFEIETERDIIRDRIKRRTEKMIETGLIDEIFYLEKKYKREINPMKAIGVKETLEYLDGYYDLEVLKEKISVNTARLAKRQKTFNKSQFRDITKDSFTNLDKIILNRYL